MKDRIRVAILGASGRMGRIIARFFSQMQDVFIAARIDCIASDDGLQPAIVTSLDQAPEFDVLVDFSAPSATMSSYETMKSRKSAWLVGTTGLSQEQKDLIQGLSTQQAVFISANTSLGIALMQRLCAQAAAALHGWDCEILEVHHHGKQDAPSGTALSLANTIAEAQRACGDEPVILTDRSALHEKRNPRSIGIASLRGGTVAGEHTAIWYGENERLEIKHTAESREIFAHGACKIAVWLAEQPAGSYQMAQFLDTILK